MKSLKFPFLFVVVSFVLASSFMFSCNNNKSEEPPKTETDASTTNPAPPVIDTNKAASTTDSTKFDSTKTEQNAPAKRVR
ncbi:MAG: hypothetical protein E6Q95_05570 [Chitinophagaceae bacterium]|nr:MAG: hypothetical protein E6Q95_05570 [Chitinophagaceae bacterium]